MARAVISFVCITAAIAFMLCLSGCSPPALVDDTLGNGSVAPPTPGTDSNTRPDIPRVNPPSDTPDSPVYKNPAEQPHGQSPIILVNKTPSVDIDVPMNDVIGAHFPIITRVEFPLLRHQPIRVSGNELIGYEETLRFDFGANSTGNITLDKVDDDLGTFLRFDRDKPIFEYRVTLSSGTFADYQGRDIQILGHIYTIAEVTNYSVAFFGKTVPSTLFFEQGKKLEVNRSDVSATLCNITGNSISYTLFTNGNDANDSIMLGPGKSLSDAIGRRALASQVFDIRYKGDPAQNATLMLLRRSTYGYRLELVTFKGKLDIPLVQADAGRLVLGTPDRPMRVTPCPANNTFCIAPGTTLPLTTSDGRTFIVSYESAHVKPNTILFMDTNANRYSYEFVGTPGAANGTVDIQLMDAKFRARIGPKDNATGEYNISVDQGFHDGIVEILDKNGAAVRIGNISGGTLQLDVVLLWGKTGSQAERIRMNATYDGGKEWHIAAGNMTFFQDRDTKDNFASTGYGALVLLRNRGDPIALNTGDEADLLLPHGQLHGTISLEG